MQFEKDYPTLGARGAIAITESQAPKAAPGHRQFDSPFPGPQVRGTGGTLNLIKCRMRPGPPVVGLLITLGYEAENLPVHAKVRKAAEVMSSRNSY